MRAALGLGLLAALCGCSPRVPLEAAPPREAERLVLDTREPEAFAAGHLPGALNLQWGWSQLEARVRSYVPDLDTPLAVRGSTPAEAERAAAVLVALGYEDVTLPPSAPETATLALITAAELRERLAGPEPPTLIDVRSEAEFETGTVAGARCVDQDLAPGLLEELDPAGSYAVVCEGGWRSSQLASLLRRHGVEDVINVIDGMAGWRALD
ncbi:MAG: rhodanese-like domain-containing protein [Planctomycetota bacterium]